MKFPKKSRLTLIGSVVLWLIAAALGQLIMLDYESSPGIAATPPPQWPSDSRIELATGRATLIMLAHPHCPCTRASIGELDMLMARVQGRVTAYVLFLRPPGFPDGWEDTDLWRSAAAIPGVKVIRDDAGGEARRFRAETSGQTLLYDADGRLLFSGGITASRGHAGDNAGRRAIVSLLTAGRGSQAETRVFGCPLRGAESECPAGQLSHATHEN